MKRKVKRVKTVKRRHRRLGELPDRSIAIRNFCLECYAYNSAETSRCANRGCWLWPYRFGPRRPSALTLVRQELDMTPEDEKEGTAACQA